ncbi:hypothetical protein Nepgr_006361 [Nepenthes gracilis]|uniref:F-box domain-containing protein n=1 Tax=Nepenthes gracilis TaxID=150966 RepID=A0AAD3S597_NEPGR|nr:hypothetical protein Nepgr_006361 [Nepenthes gracilis]
MPTLGLKYNGKDEFHQWRSFYPNSLDHSISLSVNSYYPPCKRLCVSAPIIRWENGFRRENKLSIEVLPDECLFEIFRRLSGPERSVCASVSKKWLNLLSTISKAEICHNTHSQIPNGNHTADEEVELVSDGYLIRCLEGKEATDVRLAAIAVGTSAQGGLAKLSIRGNNLTRGVTNFGLSAIARGCSSLKVLSIWNVSSIGDEGLFQIANRCRMLEKLDLCHCPSISDTGLIFAAQNCPNLTALTIESCPNIGDHSLQSVARCCLKLESISIKDCPLIGDRGVASLFLMPTSAMAKVKLHGISISDLSLAAIGCGGKSIINLVLNGLRNVSEKGFKIMGDARGLQALTSLTIVSCSGVTDESLEAIGKGCPTLKQLCLRTCFMSDNGLAAFSKSAGSLEILQLEECNRVSQLGVTYALSDWGSTLRSLTLVKCIKVEDIALGDIMQSQCTSLRSLTIRNCPGFGSPGLAMFGKICPKLCHVDLTGLHGITDDGLLSLLESCEAGLVKVNLSGCINLSDKVVTEIARLHGDSLKVLNLQGCRKITDTTLAAIANRCTLLKDLDVSNCAVSDSGLAALSFSEQLNLQILSVSGCSRISDKSMPFLVKLGKCLVGLNLKHCSSISSAGIAMLEQKLWRCEILC